MNDEQFEELKRMLLHMHSDIEACVSKIDEVERKLIMHSDKVLDPTNDDLMAGIESYSPIDESDKKLYEQRKYEFWTIIR